jgi:hypothetical protein
MGVLDHASWNAGISGGSWYVTAHYLASLQRTDALADPAAVLDAIKGQVQYSIYGDYFQGNQASGWRWGYVMCWRARGVSIVPWHVHTYIRTYRS